MLRTSLIAVPFELNHRRVVILLEPIRILAEAFTGVRSQVRFVVIEVNLFQVGLGAAQGC